MDERRTPNAQILVMLMAFGLLLTLLIGTRPPRTDRLVVYVSERNGNRDVHVIDIYTGFIQNLTNDNLTECCPQWSPDGRYIAYHVTDFSVHGIYVMNADGSNRRRLTPEGGTDFTFDWSPDGRDMAVESGYTGDTQAIYLIDVDTSSRRQLSPADTLYASPVWSPDGQQIMFLSCCIYGPNRGGLYTIHPDGTNLRLLTSDEVRPHFPRWSPDGQQIAFTSSTGDRTNGVIYVMGADGSNPRQLTPNDLDSISLKWIPDSTGIIFLMRHSDATHIGIYILDTTDGSIRPLGSVSEHISEVIYSSDGQLVVFTSHQDGDSELYLMYANGTGLRQLTDNNDEDHMIDWR
jgi:TolB protein